MKDIIQAIKNALVKEGITQKQLAERSGVAQETISRILKGKIEFTVNMKHRLLTALDLNEETISGDSSYPTLENEVNGYLEFCGEITRVRSIKEVEKWLATYKPLSKELTKKAESIIRLNEQNKKKVLAHKYPPYDFANVEIHNTECYDCSKVLCYPFKTANDVVNGIKMDVGNQINGYPFTFGGVEWANNELLYLCGQFSNNTSEHLNIQRQLAAQNNGYLAKKNIKYPNEDKMRGDWEREFAVKWMLFVLWQKAKGNEDFANKLREIPREAVLIEVATKEGTGILWGCKNKERDEAEKEVMRYVEFRNPYASKTKLNELKEEARNSLTFIGEYKGGSNVMGKLLKVVQLCLLDGEEPPIDYGYLRSKHIYLLGKELTF